MKRTTHRTACGLLVGAAALAGCQSSPPEAVPVALGEIGTAPTIAAETAERPFFFGAGDALGEEVFLYYVASLRLEQHFAQEDSALPQ